MSKVNFDELLDFLQTKMPPLIGVDISSSSVKLVELSQLPNNGSYTVECYAIEALPKDAVSDGNINNLDALAETLQRAYKRLGTRIKNVAVALPAAAVITKKILLPAGMSEEDLEFQVESEANQYIPFTLEEVNLDFQVLGPARHLAMRMNWKCCWQPRARQMLKTEWQRRRRQGLKLSW